MPCRSGFLALGTRSGLRWVKDKGKWQSGGDGAAAGKAETPREDSGLCPSSPTCVQDPRASSVQVGHRVPRVAGKSQEGGSGW